MLNLLFITAMSVSLSNSEVSSPEERAIEYLSREVPKWSKDNKCFSCHNNGDAAKSLFLAQQLGYRLRAHVLDDTIQWLTQPERWDHNGGDPVVSDKVLARIHFASALSFAIENKAISRGPCVQKAAELVVENQRPDGSWRIDAEGTIGSPVTYGTLLASMQARNYLKFADATRFRKAIDRTEVWLRRYEVKNVLNAAAMILAIDGQRGEEIEKQRALCIEMIRKAQSSEGGWGPYANSPAEVFDTALVVLALLRFKKQSEIEAMIRKGRTFLIHSQQKDGSWEETTRPSGAVSYAQRLSTTGWATQALLLSRKWLGDN